MKETVVKVSKLFKGIEQPPEKAPEEVGAQAPPSEDRTVRIIRQAPQRR
jgi:hypothetical protein